MVTAKSIPTAIEAHTAASPDWNDSSSTGSREACPSSVSALSSNPS